MTAQERHDALMILAHKLHAIREELRGVVLPELVLEVDKKAIKSITTDLTWASENCTVVALHQWARRWTIPWG